MLKGKGRIILVALNGHTFNQSCLIRFLDKGQRLNVDKKLIYFGDSLPGYGKGFRGKTKSFKLIDVYKFLFPNQSFIAHDALEDI